MFLCSSINLAVIYAYLTTFAKYLAEMQYQNFNIIIFAATFIGSGVVGALFAAYLKKKGEDPAFILRLFIVLSIINCIMWAFCVRIIVSFTIFNIAAGFALVGSIPLQLMEILDHDLEVRQPVSVNLIYFLSAFFLVLFRNLYILFEEHIGISGLWMCAITQVLVGTSYMAEYSPSTRKLKNPLLRNSI